jgi:hypothetical protein
VRAHLGGGLQLLVLDQLGQRLADLLGLAAALHA